MRPLLALALMTPVAALFPVATTPPGVPVRPWLEGAALLAAAGWLAVLIDADPELVLGRLRPVPAAAAATAGACLVVAAVRRPAGRRSVYAGGIALGGIGLGLAAETFFLLVAGLAAAAVAVAAAAWGEDEGTLPAAGLGCAGVAALAAAVVRVHGELDQWTIPDRVVDQRGLTIGLVGAGAALLVAAGGLRPRRTSALLLPAGLAAGLILLPLVRDPHDGAPVLALLLAVAAGLTAGPGVPSLSLRPLPAAVPIGLLALAAAAGPSSHLPAAAVLGAGSVVASLLATPAAIVAALPGAVAYAAALADTAGADAAVIGALMLLAAASLAADARVAPRRRRRPAPPAAAAIGLLFGTWLVLAPDTWTWVGDAALEPYQEGASAAAAAAVIVLVGSAAVRRRAPALPLGALVADDAPLRAVAPWGHRAALAGMAALGISLVVLVASATLGG